MVMKKLSAWVAALGQNMQFVAFWAHFGVGALVVIVSGPRAALYVMLAVIGLGAVKEFVFDMLYEQKPPQTWADSFEDFFGWFLGAMLGWWIGW